MKTPRTKHIHPPLAALLLLDCSSIQQQELNLCEDKTSKLELAAFQQELNLCEDQNIKVGVVRHFEMKLLLLLQVSLVTVVVSKGKDDSCSMDDSAKADCGYSGIDQDGCEDKGCCWSESSTSGIPWCYYTAGTNTNCFGFQNSISEPFSSKEVSQMRSYFLENINIENKGGVVAAPDHDTPGGNYYYHWMRDGALTMRCLQDTNPGEFSDIEATVKSYVQWVLGAQNQTDPNDQDVRTEPKFMLPDGEVFTDPWCRPQNDGPGLRATALMIAADSLIADGQSDYVKQNLWTGDASDSLHGGAIKYDLDYIVTGYDSNTCDLWEEIRDPDFFWNRVTMKKALLLGADFAEAMGDSASASAYKSTMQAINSTLYSAHYNGEYVQECTSRTRDSAVIVGFNDAYHAADGMFAPAGLEAAKTVNSYNNMFCSEYAINTQDSQDGLPGVLYGRYQGDSYAGGNPWVLSTAALASLCYRAADDILSNGAPSDEALEYWTTAFNAPSALSDLRMKKGALAQVFAAQGDGVLLRLRNHVEADDFHLDEQIDRNTGEQMSAEDLTWSYAEVLNAMHYRDLYLTQAKRSV